MLKKQQNADFSPLQEASKPLEYDSLKKDGVFEQSWQSKGESKLSTGDSMSIDHSGLYSSQLIGEDLESVSLSGLEMKFEKEMDILKESFISSERGYHEAPKFLMSYSDLYKSQASQCEGDEKPQGPKPSSTLLTAQPSSCWSSNCLFEHNYGDTSANRAYQFKDENVFLEEDDGILDVLSHTLSKTCLEDETMGPISVVGESCKYTFATSISSSPASASCRQSILSESAAGRPPASSGSSSSSLTPYVLGLRVFRLVSPNKKQVSTFQLNTYDIMNLCSQFGNIVEISISNEGHCVTYESRESLERALSSLQNLQISSEGDFIHAYIHQTSNTMIGGLERTIHSPHAKWNHDFSPTSLPSIREMCGTMGFVDKVGMFGSTNAAISASCRSNAATSASGASTTTNASTGSPWNSFDGSSISTYERNLWSSWLQDGSKGGQSIGIPKGTEGCENSSIQVQEEIETADSHGHNHHPQHLLQLHQTGQEGSTIKQDVAKSSKTKTGSRVGAMTYSSIVGSNLNKGHFVKGISPGQSCSGNENSVVGANNSIRNKPCVQDNNAFKLAKMAGKLDETEKGAGSSAPASVQSPSSASLATTPSQNASNVLKKYTARYEIQIPPDNQFQIARRIIGTRGINMKRIFKLTQSKLRLRGKGSGYLEGYNKQEADEPLHLCISSTNSEQYINARKLVERLLLKIYQEYDDFLLSNNNNHKTLNLQLKFKETMRTKQLSSGSSSCNSSGSAGPAGAESTASCGENGPDEFRF